MTAMRKRRRQSQRTSKSIALVGNVTEDTDCEPSYAAYAASKAAGPKNPGGKSIPEGAPECLANLTFVFTGELETLGRDEAVELAKRYGA